jgi:hypothetical protein
MRKQQKSMLVLAVMAAFMATVMFLPGLIGAGELDPPDPPTTGTMHTLEEIYNELQSIKNTVNLNKCINLGHRFCDQGDGTVLDIDTGLVWLKNANCFGAKNWNDASSATGNLAEGQCGLADGSQAGDWRLPTDEELCGLGSDGVTGSPFFDVQSEYWTNAYNYDCQQLPEGQYCYEYSNVVHIGSSSCPVEIRSTGSTSYVWPVRGGN